jgi:hypothetical protein
MLRTGAFRDPDGSLTVARHLRRILGLLMQGAYAVPGAYAASWPSVPS